MQREIKFRAWDKENKQMINIARFDFTDWSIYTHLFGKAIDGLDCEIMQYTGLKDKNGKTDAYEGDILQKPYGEDKTQYGIVKAETKTCNLHVEWNFKGKYEGKEYYDTNILPLRRIEDMIVIGNIYANPELLQKAGE